MNKLQMVLKTAEKEWETYKQELMELPGEQILEKSKETWMKEELLNAFRRDNLLAVDLDEMMGKERPLEYLFKKILPKYDEAFGRELLDLVDELAAAEAE